MLDLLIKNATVVTLNSRREIIPRAAIAIQGDRLLDVGPMAALAAKYGTARRVIEADGQVVFPGLINTHTHSFQTLLKGLGDDRILPDWIAQMTSPSAAYLEAEDAYYAALLVGLEALHSGTTTVLDYMYAHPEPYLSDPVIKAFQELGLRAVFGRGMSDLGRRWGIHPRLVKDQESIQADSLRVFQRYHGSNQGRLRVWLAPGSVWGNSRENLIWLRRTASELKTGLTIHVSETPFDRRASEVTHGQADIDVLEAIGFLGPDVLLVHCVHLKEREIRLLKALDVRVSHNPVSNMYLSSGVAPIPRMLESQITVSLGTDGAASNNTQDMLETLKVTALLHKAHSLDPTVITAERVLEMATLDGARSLNWEDEIGSLEVGKKADLFIFNPGRNAKATPLHHPISTLLYSSSQANVQTVVIDGQVVLEDGAITTVNEARILREAQKVAERLARRAGTDRLAKRPWRALAF
ncbi:MAG: amidohydrolase [Firmicutes bacterium]|nr:amidohydrolase [Bacillota bacterium]MCL5039237.1 amidohydrolase [Bacillota bacterium]